MFPSIRLTKFLPDVLNVVAACQVQNCGLPPHSAERLGLSLATPLNNYREAEPRDNLDRNPIR
jgi:hypothetical protein